MGLRKNCVVNNGLVDVGFDNATSAQDGFMSAQDKQQLTDLASSAPTVPSTEVALANGVDKALFTVDMTKVADRSFACMIFIAVEATDNVNVQIRSGNVIANVARASNGTYATTAADRTSNANTTGSLTVTFSWSTSGSIATFVVNASSNLPPTDLHVKFYIPYVTHQGALALV